MTLTRNAYLRGGRCTTAPCMGRDGNADLPVHLPVRGLCDTLIRAWTPRISRTFKSLMIVNSGTTVLRSSGTNLVLELMPANPPAIQQSPAIPSRTGGSGPAPIGLEALKLVSRAVPELRRGWSPRRAAGGDAPPLASRSKAPKSRGRPAPPSPSSRLGGFRARRRCEGSGGGAPRGDDRPPRLQKGPRRLRVDEPR
jgi:hypothetical protein